MQITLDEELCTEGFRQVITSVSASNPTVPTVDTAEVHVPSDSAINGGTTVPNELSISVEVHGPSASAS